MVSKTFRYLLEGINSTWNETLHGITFKPGVTENGNTAAITNLSLQVEQDNQTSIYKIQTVTEIYKILSTTLITSEAENSTQSTMTRNIVSAFTINNSDLLDKPHHNIMVAILLGIFTCISVTLTISIFVFCRKKNSVFMLQKCEQDSDVDLEMNDMNTEIETSDSEYEFIESTSPEHLNRRSQTCPNLSNYINNENTSEENRQFSYDQHSTNRRSFNKQKRELSDSPTSTPLLNSTSQTSLTINERKPLRKKSRRSLSLNFENETSEAAANISGRKLNQSKTKHSFTDDAKLTSQSCYRHTKSCKMKRADGKQCTGKIINSEHGFFEINVKYSNQSVKYPNERVKTSTGSVKTSKEGTKKSYQFLVEENGQKEQNTDSSILRMETMDEGSECFTVHDLLEENDDQRISDGKLEIF